MRVSEARVRVGGETVGEIGRGLLVLLGVGHDDADADADALASKVRNLRIFPDGDDKMNLSILDTGGAVLVVSQFTLCGDARRGRRPSYSAAADPDKARSFYDRFNRQIRSRGIHVETGEFAARMEVSYTNAGPVTILLDSTKLF